jgi:hypothetical protein
VQQLSRSPCPRHARTGSAKHPPLAHSSGAAAALHSRFVTKLLNDLFGVQSRGDCACAVRPALLGVGEDLALRIRDAIVKGYHGMKPGWTRFRLAYYLSHDEFFKCPLSSVPQ